MTNQLIAIYACGDRDELDVSFDRWSLASKTALKLLLYVQSVNNNQLKYSAERSSFLEKLKLVHGIVDIIKATGRRE